MIMPLTAGFISCLTCGSFFMGQSLKDRNCSKWKVWENIVFIVGISWLGWTQKSWSSAKEWMLRAHPAPSTVRSTNPHLSSSKTAKGTRMSESLCWQHLRFTPGFAGPIICRIASWGNMRLCTIFSWEVSWVLQHPGTLLSNGPRWERCPS